MKKKESSKKPLVFLIITVLLALYVFFAAPNLNPLYADGALFWLVVVTVYVLVATMSSFHIADVSSGEGGQASFHLDRKKLPKKWVLILLGALWIIYVLVHLIFTPLFFWGSYRDQMAEPEIKQFTSEVQPVDPNQIPIVDADLAATLANRKLGEKPALGSQVVLGTPTIQNVNGELVWVVPLQHSGFFKWIANLDGSAGYIKVSATNLQDVQYVGDYKIKVQPNCYFMDDLSRRVRFMGGLFTGITDYSFELDDSGKPYWVVTTYKNTCGFGLPEADGIILVDAQTGSAKRYGLADVPGWVDRVQPESFILSQINNKGKYIHGVFNFSNKDKYMATPGHNIIYNSGHCYYFTGVTSVGIDESATGFIMVNMVTKQPILYRMSGATEQSAQQSAEGKVQDLRYYASFPIILNVYDQPTYFMTLKDSGGLIKMYAFVNVQNYVAVGVGTTMDLAQADYAQALKNLNSGPAFDPGDSGEQATRELTGTIGRINSVSSGGSTLYYFTLNEAPNQIFTADLALSSQLPLTVPGDHVTVRYTQKEALASALSFENSDLFGGGGSSAPPVSAPQSSEPAASEPPTSDAQSSAASAG